MNNGQQKLLDLMKLFDKRCREYGIVYYLGGGSALGAIRHNGFIPWDDDVDLYITRNNYLKLIENKDSFFTDDFILVNHEEFPLYGNTLVRCVSPDDALITKARIADGTPKGSFIELFIMDPVPKDKKERDLWLKKHYVYTEIMATYYRVANPRIERWIDMDIYNSYIERCANEGREAVLTNLEEELFKISEPEASEWCSRWGMRNLFYDKEWFGEPRYVPFEDTELPVPTFAENVLRFDYGDRWMYVPEVEDQITHSYAESRNIPYRFFVEDYSRFIDIEKLRNKYEPRKQALISAYSIFRKNHYSRLKIKNLAVNASIERTCPPKEALTSLLENGEYDQLCEYFEVWDIQQTSPSFWKWEKPVLIDQEKLLLVLAALFLQGDFPKVRKILLWNQRERALSPDCMQLLKAVEAIRNAYIAIDNEQFNEAATILNETAGLNFASIEAQFDYRYLSSWLYCNGYSTQFVSNDSRLTNIVCELIEQHPDRGEVHALYADMLLLTSNNYENAYQHYALALESTRNAFVIKHAREQLAKKQRN